MKLLLKIALFLTASRVGAFSPMRPVTSTTSLDRMHVSSTGLRALYFAEEEQKKTENDDSEVASMSGAKESDVESITGSIYDKLGFQEDQIALGINPEQVLEFIGTRDDIIERFKKDNTELDDERAQKEADKFMMDAEMVNMLMSYENRKSRGEIVSEGPEFDWFTVLVGGYLVYVVASVILKQLNRNGELDRMIQGVQSDTVQGAVEAVQATSDAVQNVALESSQSTVQATLDFVQSTM